MSVWIAFGLGFLCGSIVLDVLWRMLRHETEKLLEAQREYIAQLEAFKDI